MTLIAWALFVAVAYGLPWYWAVAITSAWWLLTLPGNTWYGYAAAMTYDRVKRGCTVVLPPEDQRLNEPDIDRLVKYQLWLPAALKNYVLGKLLCVLYFHRVPHWRDGGLTMTLNRMVAENPPGSRTRVNAERIQRRYLDRYDRRAKHT